MDTSILSRLLEPDILGVMIPILGIMIFGGLAIIRAMFRHSERMAMIEHGIHPDYPPEEVEENATTTNQSGETGSDQLGNRLAALNAR